MEDKKKPEPPKPQPVKGTSPPIPDPKTKAEPRLVLESENKTRKE